MQSLLKIQIVSDVSCPWCIIGYQSLSQALHQLPPGVTFHIAWKPFELNPDMPAAGQLLGEHLHEKYGSSSADIAETSRMITARGAALGFHFNFKNDGRIYNTFNAHRLLYWASQFDQQTELKLALFALYFTDGGNPGSTGDLLKAVSRAGLSPDEARQIIESDRYVKEVRAEEAKYQMMGISSVPTFIINDKYTITGGQAVDVFVSALEKIIREEANTKPA